MRTAILIGMLGVSTACYSYNPLTTPAGSAQAVRVAPAKVLQNLIDLLIDKKVIAREELAARCAKAK